MPFREDDEREEPGPDDQPGAAGSTDDDIRTLAQVAEAFDVAEEDFLTAIRVSGRSEAEEVPLGQIVREWREGAGNPANAPAVRAEVAKLQTRQAELEEEYGAKGERLQRYLDAMLVAVAGEDDVDWDKLRAEVSSDEYLERWTRYSKRREAFQNAFQHLEGQAKEAAKRAEQVQAEESEREFEALMSARPAWREKPAFDEAMTRLQDAALALGYSADELAAVTDHRIFVALDLVSQQLKAEKLRNEKLPGLRQLPRLSARATARPGEGAEKQDLRDRALAAHRKRGDVDSAAAALMSMDL